MKIAMRKDDGAKLPSYAHPGDAGMDLYSNEELVLKPGEKKIVKTGAYMAIPGGHVGLIWDKSGHAAKNAIHVLAGVVDAGYRGEVGVVLKNLGDAILQTIPTGQLKRVLCWIQTTSAL